ncbi:DUF1289 domain-containing protein [Rhizobium sp. P44RR-XXIV]|uniref:DUF1289 domain-containing protein n=1 Tax=Rhizobium sp. P44RR-XXIV TaxID=1921145 RepID=UPI000984CF33|nr:DUF1289 domain-containing protein [Rhizobium sp. P44RR-XXIV]TIX88872.1 DUF1289 domain-containing protein [Rhizobium sp. P44RR-XXIV]
MLTPCILICSIDDITGYCFGCGRTATEIGAWMNYSDDERRQLMEILPERLTKVERKPRRETRRQRLAKERNAV